MNIGNFFKKLFGGKTQDTIHTSTDSAAVITTFSDMNMSELRGIAKTRGLKGWTKLRKSELIEFLNNS